MVGDCHIMAEVQSQPQTSSTNLTPAFTVKGMTKQTEIKWPGLPRSHDYPAGRSCLKNICDDKPAQKPVNRPRQTLR